MIAPVEAEIRQRLGVFIYGVDTESLEEVVARLLRQQGKTLAIIESNTAGALTQWLRATGDAAVLAAALGPPKLVPVLLFTPGPARARTSVESGWPPLF